MYGFDCGSGLNEPDKEKKYNISSKLALMFGYFEDILTFSFNCLNQLCISGDISQPRLIYL